MSRPLSYSSVSSINHAWEAVANQIGFAIFGDSSSKEVKSDPTYVFLEPVLRVTADERGSSVWSASGLRQRSLCHWDALSKLISFLDSKPTHSDEPPVPFAFGMLSYELLHLIESVPRNKIGPIPPYLYDFYLYKRVLRIDHTISEFVYNWPEYHKSFWENTDVVIPEISSVNELLSSKSYLESEPDSLSLEEFSNFSMRAYINSVSDIKSRIRKGDVYQVNLSQRFTLPFEQSAFEYYRALRQVSPSRFGGYFSTQNHSGPVAIASASPELFFSANDQSVSCSPIKGTRRRSPDAFLDIQIQNELKSSEKDLAELAMIVDL
ncbi:MAG: chorismate-binding protein, partial [Bdellovibrionales bacterium]|nr:chorismate-binding protein [Bdellovibrionales bacterium]